MKLFEFINILEKLAPLHLAESYDNVGLLCGNLDQSVTGVIVALDTTESVVDEAIARGVNVILGFHPIIFKPLQKLTGRTYTERAFIKAIKADVAIYAIHTALDNVPYGVSGMMCQKLGLRDTQVLIPKQQDVTKHVNPDMGLGMVGYLPSPMKEQAMLQRLKEVFGTPVVRHSELRHQQVHKIAVLGGSGSFAIEKAIADGADIFVSADFKYHDFFRAESKILLADIGHYESEQYTIDLMADYLQTAMPDQYPIYKTTVCTNPVFYYCSDFGNCIYYCFDPLLISKNLSEISLI